ncbi:DUF1275 family protein [Streptomyces polygonati]|uniref:DUF1275 family protein n=1 Tax=Streptomyces polygonati TaxID=1617087 RepID=A0ABV8HH04_9ACTN
MPLRSTASASLLLLTLATGAVNAIGFMALGGVFTSVMTANLGLLGLAAGGGRAALAGHAAVAIAGFAAGVPIGGRLAATEGGSRWAGVRGALAAELLILCGITAAWAALDGRPGGTGRLVLLAAAAVAMGCQSGTVQVGAPPGTSTTYLTGAITGVLSELARTGAFRARTALVIAMLPLGAALGGLLVTRAREAAPAAPALLVGAALALSWRGAAPSWRETPRAHRAGEPRESPET